MKTLSSLAIVALLVLTVEISEAQPEELQVSSGVGISLQMPSANAQCELDGLSSAITNATCLMCGSGSTGSCARRKGKARVQCRGTRKDCRARGCAITGTALCSSAGNVQSC